MLFLWRYGKGESEGVFKLWNYKFYENKNLSLKAHYYEAKAQDYLSNLLKLLISSPSPAGLGEGCLPYASEDFVDTGHGWTTP
ncbi:MAG: hypothetical protein ACK4G3_03215, partial [bacterium]